MTTVTFIIRLLGYCKICKENSQVDSRMNTHAEGSIRVYLKTVSVLFLQGTNQVYNNHVIWVTWINFHQNSDMLTNLHAQGFIIDPINPLNAELNPICHLLVLLEAHHIFHVSRIRVNITLKTKIKIVWAPGLSEQHPYLTQVTKLDVNSAVLIDVCRGICNNILGRLHFQLTLRRLMSYIYIWSTHSWCF